MEIEFHKGFIVYKNGRGPVFVPPHSGPALEIPTSRDDNADTVASLCWLRMGGSLVVSTMPRKVMLGIDFNREPPPGRKALGFWERFGEESDWKALEEYRKAYAWVASSRADHRGRLRIYNDFWKAVRGLGDTVTFVHRKFTRIKNFPSIMDIVTYRGYGVSRGIMQSVVSGINREYGDFFRRIGRDYRDAILLEEKRAVERMLEIFGKLDMNEIKAEYREHLVDGMRVIKRFAPAEKARGMERKLSKASYMSALRAALKQDVRPEVTIESIFRGESAWSRKSRMFRRKNVLEAEVNAFLSYWHPGKAAEMIVKIIDKVRTIRKLPLYMEW